MVNYRFHLSKTMSCFFYFCIFGWTRGISSDFNLEWNVILPARPGSVRQCWVNLHDASPLGKTPKASQPRKGTLPPRAPASLLRRKVFFCNVSDQVFEPQSSLWKTEEYWLARMWSIWRQKLSCGKSRREKYEKLLRGRVFLSTCSR